MTDGLRQKATRSIGWVVVERWGNRLISLLVLIVLTRALSPSDFGLVSLAASVTALLQVVVDSGLSRALVQRKQLGPNDATTAFWTAMLFSIVVAVAAILAAPAIASAFRTPALTPVLQVMVLVLPLGALSQTPAALLERDFEFKTLSIRQLIGALAGALVSIPLALVGYGVWALVAQSLVSAAASVFALWMSTSWRPRFAYSWTSLRSLWKISVTVLAIDLLDALQANIDKLVIGAFFSTTELGYYYLAQRIGSILTELVTTVISRVSFTTFSRVQDDPVRLNRIFRQLTFAASAICTPVFGLLALLSPQIVPYIFGPEWVPTVVLIWILAPGWALLAVMYFDRTVLIATGRTGTALGLALFQNVVGIALVFALLPLGVIGVALSRLSRLATLPVRLIVLKRVVGIQVWPYMQQTLRCLVAVAPVLVCIGLLQTTGWAQAGVSFWTFAVPLGVVGCAVYGGLLWCLAGAENRAVLRSMWVEAHGRLVRRSA